MGFFRLKLGGNQIGIEQHCTFGVPGSFTQKNFPCWENGKNCETTTYYVDPHKLGKPYAEIM